MKSRAAVLFDAPGDWEVIEVEVDDPKEFEVLVRFQHAGLCHSDPSPASALLNVVLRPAAGLRGGRS